MAAPPAVSLLEILHGICDMEGMKKSSPATKDVVERAHRVSSKGGGGGGGGGGGRRGSFPPPNSSTSPPN